MGAFYGNIIIKYLLCKLDFSGYISYLDAYLSLMVLISSKNNILMCFPWITHFMERPLQILQTVLFLALKYNHKTNINNNNQVYN